MHLLIIKKTLKSEICDSFFIDEMFVKVLH